MKKLLKSKKALSPVVAAIILIAVTVAVSIAVAAWMGSLTFTFMETEEIKITSVTFAGASSNGLNVTVMNTGTTDVVISGVTVTGSGAGTATLNAATYTIAKGGTNTVDINLSGTYSDGVAYNIELLSTKGNKFTYTDTAPN
jgi:flagellin-like protein